MNECHVNLLDGGITNGDDVPNVLRFLRKRRDAHAAACTTAPALRGRPHPRRRAARRSRSAGHRRHHLFLVTAGTENCEVVRTQNLRVKEKKGNVKMYPVASPSPPHACGRGTRKNDVTVQVHEGGTVSATTLSSTVAEEKHQRARERVKENEGACAR